MLAIGMQMETVVMASPDRADVIGLLEHGNVEPRPAHCHGTRQPCGAGTYDDRVGRFCHASPVSSFASDAPSPVIASEAKQSRNCTARRVGLLRRFAPRNDDKPYFPHTSF